MTPKRLPARIRRMSLRRQKRLIKPFVPPELAELVASYVRFAECLRRQFAKAGDAILRAR